MTEPIRVSELSAWLRDHLEENFAHVAVVGEITGHKLFKHHYFALKDGSDLVHCTYWLSGRARPLSFQPADGMQVVAQGRITYYGPQAKLQINVNTLQPVGVGAAELAKQKLLQKLEANGFFDPSRKRPLPRYPRRVALVTSGSGAAVRDMIASFRNRWVTCELVVCDCLVQGDRAVSELAAALQRISSLHESHLRFDAVILGRGGGSKEDLIAFDSERVAVAIRDCTVPVISAVGHETDVSIADRVADARANTPTHAVELITPNAAELIQSFHRQRDRMRSLLHGKCANIRRRLEFIGNRRDFLQPFDRIRRAEQKLDDLGERMKIALERKVRQFDERLKSVSQRLQALSPLNVLGRGYSVVRKSNGRIVKHIGEVSVDEEIRITLARGELKAMVSSAIPVSEQ